MICGIHHIAIHVKDFDKMLRFYVDAFGFEVAGAEQHWKDSATIDSIIGLKNSEARTVMLRAGNTHIEMFEYFAPKSRDISPLAPSDRGYTHFCVDVKDIEAEYKRLSALGMKFKAPAPVDAQIVKTVYGTDPEGNLIEIQETLASCPFDMKDLKKSS